jgi:hypothetical protein
MSSRRSSNDPTETRSERAALVEENQTSESPQALYVRAVSRFTPHVLEMADPPRNNEQIDRAGAEDLKRNVDLPSARISGWGMPEPAALRRRGLPLYRGIDPCGDFAPRMKPKLVPDLLDVVFGRPLRHRQALGDFAVGQTLCHEISHLSLAPAQLQVHPWGW